MGAGDPQAPATTGAMVPAVLPALDIVRSIRGLLGLNPFVVFVRTRVWSGKIVGDGSYEDNGGGPDVQLTVGVPPIGPKPVTVRFLSNQEIIASGGLYRDRDMRVGPMTPPYPAGLFLAAGGTGDPTLDPQQAGSVPTEIFWWVQGPSIPLGAWCRLLRLEGTALHFSFVLRADGTQP